MFITQAWNISQLDAVYRTSTKSREIGWRSERNRLNRLITRTSDSIECIVDRCSRLQRLQRLQGSACSADADLAFLGGALLVESMGGGHRDLIQSLSAQIPRAQSCSNMDKTWENSFNMCQSTWLPMVPYTSEGLFPADRSSNYYTRNPLLQLIPSATSGPLPCKSWYLPHRKECLRTTAQRRLEIGWRYVKQFWSHHCRFYTSDFSITDKRTGIRRQKWVPLSFFSSRHIRQVQCLRICPALGDLHATAFLFGVACHVSLHVCSLSPQIVTKDKPIQEGWMKLWSSTVDARRNKPCMMCNLELK